MFVEDGRVQVFHQVMNAANDALHIYNDIVDLAEDK